MSLWRISDSEWAVCDGPGPNDVKGYLIEREGSPWAIKDDASQRQFLRQIDAAASVLNRQPPSGAEYLTYILKRGHEEREIVTDADMVKLIIADGGWSRVSKSWELNLPPTQH